MDISSKKIAIVHDWLTNMGGAENVVEVLHDMFPDAPIYTSMCIKENISLKLQTADIRASFLQKKVKGHKVNHQKYLPWMPAAFESFDLNEYDLVISSSSCCAKGVITAPHTVHVCYCYTPTRYLWQHFYEYTKDMNPIKKHILLYYMNYLRIWDYSAAQRVDHFIAISNHVASRIKKYYRRDAEVIYPPVKTEYFTPGDKDGDFFLVVSRLVGYKRIDIAVEAFNKLNLPLIIIGEGPEQTKLKSLAKSNVLFLGRQSDEVVRDYMRKCKAMIFPGEEDFGITPVEMQACGRSVIAYGKGGSLETVIDKETGLFFQEQTAESLVNIIEIFHKKKFSIEVSRIHAASYSDLIFKQSIKSFFQSIKIYV
ncbi:glycosyl transferase [Clostridia bacterium]|nr:glycosyl transferase [Clostridia bacterium]